MEIVWTREAEESYTETVEDILNKWTIKELVVFADKTEDIIALILKNNEIGKLYKKTAFRQFLITEQTYLFYKLVNNKVYLILFWNNRKNPLKLDSVLTP
jgi:plasmid stabilization system protein ParE